jgi:hypothetical protein
MCSFPLMIGSIQIRNCKQDAKQIKQTMCMWYAAKCTLVIIYCPPSNTMSIHAITLIQQPLWSGHSASCPETSKEMATIPVRTVEPEYVLHTHVYTYTRSGTGPLTPSVSCTWWFCSQYEKGGKVTQYCKTWQTTLCSGDWGLHRHWQTCRQ